MIDFPISIGTLLQLSFATVILWKTIVIMIERKRMKPFLPFFMLGITLCIHSSFLFYELFSNSLWTLLETMYLISFLFLLMTVRKEYQIARRNQSG